MRRISKDEINELKRAISIFDISIKTGNEALDVILAEKSLFCEKNNIKLNSIVSGECLKFMSSSDIYSLFGNAIDNAIEAVENLEETSKRIISISVKESMGMVSIHFENYYSGQLVLDNGMPVTTKNDKKIPRLRF